MDGEGTQDGDVEDSEITELPINILLPLQSSEASGTGPEDNKCSGSIPDVTDLVEI